MTPVTVEHGELKLIGIPCIGLNEMRSKYRNAKESLLAVSKHIGQVVQPNVHYGIWPQGPSQSDAETHAYILCVEVTSFEGVPDWFLKVTLAPQTCVVTANYSGNFDLAGQAIDRYITENGLRTGAPGRAYTICERYNYDGEGFARYSLPIQHSL